jgi:amino acid permease
VGMIFGAGVFALPDTFARAGIFWGFFHFALAFVILLFLHLLYGEIAFYTGGKHRLTGYVEIFLGKWAKELIFLTTIVSYYGSLLVYGLLAGLFLANIFVGLSAANLAVLFFVFCGILLLYRKGNTSSINFYLTIPLFGFILYLLFLALPHIKITNFSFWGADWFLPYGVWLFALSGFSVIPEIRDIFVGLSVKKFKTVISSGFIIAAFFFLVFILAVYGTGGSTTTEDAISGLAAVLGAKALAVGSLIGFLAVFGAYLALALDMKNIFKIDYKIPNFISILLTVIPPLILFLIGAHDFVKILGVTGTLGMGVVGVFIILMYRKLRKTSFWFENFVLIAVLAGVFYELWRIIF